MTFFESGIHPLVLREFTEGIGVGSELSEVILDGAFGVRGDMGSLLWGRRAAVGCPLQACSGGWAQAPSPSHFFDEMW